MVSDSASRARARAPGSFATVADASSACTHSAPRRPFRSRTHGRGRGEPSRTSAAALTPPARALVSAGSSHEFAQLAKDYVERHAVKKRTGEQGTPHVRAPK